MSNALTVTVSAGYRVHLGFYRFYDPPYAYGSIGVALSVPRLRLKLIRREGGGVKVSAPTPESQHIIKEVLSTFTPEFKGEITLDGHVKHLVGLGTRTRVVMSLLRSLREARIIHGDLVNAARKAGVGGISSVGIYSFIKGGLVVDSGIRTDGEIRPPEIIYRSAIPADWRIIVVIPEGRSGLTEASEGPIMNRPEPHVRQKELYSALLSLLHSVRSEDFGGFALSVEKIQRLTGEYFSKYQGGIFCCEESATAASMLRNYGASGIGQSSWGPAVYGFVPSLSRAEHVVNELRTVLSDIGVKCEIWCSRIPSLGHRVRLSNGGQ